MKLFEIDEKLNLLLESLIDEETGEFNDDIYEELNQVQMERDAKVESIAMAYLNKLSDLEQLTERRKAFAEREASAKKQVERLKQYLDYACGGEKFETSNVSIKYRKSTAVHIDDDAEIDNKYCVVKVEPSKSLIKEALKNGEKIDGCYLEEKQSISIK